MRVAEKIFYRLDADLQIICSQFGVSLIGTALEIWSVKTTRYHPKTTAAPSNVSTC